MHEIFPRERATEVYERTMSGKARFRVVLRMESKGLKVEKKTPNAQHPTPNVQFRKSVLVFD